MLFGEVDVYEEDELLPVSALQHILFCERQCALIHVERLWSENRYTAEGRIMHERVHTAASESRGRVRIEFGVPLRCLRLGLVGQADVVEFHHCAGSHAQSGTWQPFPVEYKRGKAKAENWDRVQLCAQALCLEEMLSVKIVIGALFYGRQRRRQIVAFDARIRQETEETVRRLHELVAAGRTPEPKYTSRCQRCSFLNVCLPRAVGRKKSVAGYLQTIVRR